LHDFPQHILISFDVVSQTLKKFRQRFALMRLDQMIKQFDGADRTGQMIVQIRNELSHDEYYPGLILAVVASDAISFAAAGVNRPSTSQDPALVEEPHCPTLAIFTFGD
jgi:hypothetical protein